MRTSALDAINVEQGNRSDFVALYEAHIAEIYAYCLRRTGEHDAQDAAAEIFTIVWRRRADMPPGDEVRPWIYGVARNVLANRRRSARRRLRLEARLKGLRPVEAVAPDAGIERRSDQEMVLKALERLPEKDREVIRLVEWEGVTRVQVARMFGVSRAAIDQRLLRAYRKLGRLLPDEVPMRSDQPQAAGRGDQ